MPKLSLKAKRLPPKRLPMIKRKTKTGMIGLDTEATGLDLRHGARPFLVMTCNENNEVSWWGTEEGGSWRIDPITRKVYANREDLLEIKDTIENAELLILQNAKFDVIGLTLLMADYGISLDWPWERTRDTLYSGHLLASGQAHDLTTMAMVYLRTNIQPLEDALEVATRKARDVAKKIYPEWRIAKEGLPEMPSAKPETKENRAKGTQGSSPWKSDTWLPEMIAEKRGYPPSHEWRRVCLDYALADPAVTLKLWQVHERMLKERGYWKVYLERLKVMPALNSLENAGVTISEIRTNEMESRLHSESTAAGEICKKILRDRGHDLILPRSGNNKNLTTAVFDVLKLPVLERSEKTNAPSLNKRSLERWATELEGDEAEFAKQLLDKRARDTAIGFIGNYRRFWIACGVKGWRKLYITLNATGTGTLRFSSSNPNAQNLSKKEKANLRYIFGPMPDREWWSMDAKNLELRIPAWIAGEQSMIDLFEREGDQPYFGSYHLLVFDILHPDLFAKHGAECKKLYEDTWYGWTKGGNFAVLNGAVEDSGTADRAYHMKGAHAKIKGRLKNLTAAGEKTYQKAKATGVVETAPDRGVDPDRGYPLMCTRTKHGQVKPTVPWSYVVQGTAMWWMCKAMVRCYRVLSESNANLPQKDSSSMILQVHDQLVFDMPKSKFDPRELKGRDDKKRRLTNIELVENLKKAMEDGGSDIGVKTPVSVEYHPENLAKGYSIKV